ncbi:hypothetical protein [Paenibacillus abyssi]|uniref:Uncharacterized protein n=1 Tax=Paenibacillus abyssi TaxID=1340531 RepID=A0A917LF30_9BACL|nr:hypothetical protein [Paenibacillus abyssi]GGG18177.1 hypothetical protein GCM10010916_38740 [Paenibacillus abyssi]
MAVPFFEKTSGIVVIEWYEAKETSSSPTKHHFEAKPIKLQLHPKDPSKVVRIYFDGKMPGWMNRYIKEKEHPFECKELFQAGQVGWWIANWRTYETGMKPLSSPTIRGSINAFIDLIPAVVEDYRERVREGFDVIESNLAIEPDFYRPFGLYYRAEEITGDGGSMLIDPELLPNRMADESDDDFEGRIRSYGQLDRLIFELTTPLPTLTGEEDDSDMPAAEEDEEFELSFEEGEDFAIEGVGTLTFEDEGEEFELHFEESGDDPLLGIALDFEDEAGTSTDSETVIEDGDDIQSAEAVVASVVVTEEPQLEAGAEEEHLAVESESVYVIEGDGSFAPTTAEVAEEPASSAEEAAEPETATNCASTLEEQDEIVLSMVDCSNRKHSAVAGQLSFF